MTIALDVADARAGKVRTRTVLGVKMTLFTERDLVDFVLQGRGRRTTAVVASLNMHGLYMYITDPTVRALHDRPDTYQRIDGVPIVWLGAAGGLKLRLANRIPWNDLIRPLLREAEARGRRVFYVGSSQAVLDRALALIRRECPNLVIAGRNGYFDARPRSPENEAVLEAIAAFKPDLLVVGMGMPRQERWLTENLDRLNAPVAMTCGAAMEVLIGALPKPPAWISRSGLEGPYRLLYSPRRTWRRYLLEPWTVLGYVARNLVDRAGRAR